MVVGHLRIVKDVLRFGKLLSFLKQLAREGFVSTQALQDAGALGIDIIRQESGIDTRISDHLLLVKALDKLECLFCAESKLAVTIDLKGCQVVETFGAFLARLLLYIGNSEQAVLDGFECSLCLLHFIIPAFRAVECHIPIDGLEFPILLGHEVDDFEMTFHNHGQRRGLHTSDGKDLTLSDLSVAQGVETGGIHAEQPVADGSTQPRQIKAIVFSLKFQMLEPFSYGFVSHRIDPQTINGDFSFFLALYCPRLLHDPALYQFTLLPGIATVDDALGILVEPLDDIELFSDAVVVLQGDAELLWNDG